jgi:hypothetical protein
MSVPSSGGGGDFRVGDVLSRAWTILTNNLLFFIGTTLLVWLAIIVLIAVVGGVALVMTRGYGAVFVVIAFVAVLAAIVVNMLGQATLLFGAFQYLRGLPVRLGESLSRATARLGPLIGVTVLTAICLFFAAFALLVPAIILGCMWAVVVPVCVVEGSGVTDSMSRSAALTKGHRWQIFGIGLLLLIVNVIVGEILSFALTPVSAILAGLVNLVWTVVFSSYGHCVVIMIYHDLRVAKEGIDTAQIASVFD